MNEAKNHKDKKGENLVEKSPNAKAEHRPTTSSGEPFMRRMLRFLYQNMKIIIPVCVVVLLLLIYILFIHKAAKPTILLVQNNDIPKPLSDKREYRILKLTNNLEALLMYDPNTSMCGASLAVGVGSFQNSPNIPGGTHLLEHMLFLGTKQDPNAGGKFTQYISNHYGGSNAYTASEKTVYYFQVAPDGFNQGLKYFSEMIGSPSLNKTMINKEMNAVNSEHEKNLNTDSWKELMLVKTLANPSSPFSLFTTGNNEVFNSVSLDELHKNIKNLYKKYYIPNNMRVAILSNQPLDTMQTLTENLFSEIRSEESDNMFGLKNYTFAKTDYPFEKYNMGQIVWYKKIQAGQKLSINFYCDSLFDSYLDSKPSELFKFQITSANKGSLLWHLRKENLVIDIDVDTSETYRKYSFVIVTIELTKQGLNKVDSVLELFYYYLNKLRHNRNLASYDFEYFKKILKNRFNFKEKSTKVGKTLASIASDMFEAPLKNILSYDYQLGSFNSDHWTKFLKDLIPENSVILVGTDYDLPQPIVDRYFSNSTILTEKWYKTKYRASKLSIEDFVNYDLYPKDKYKKYSFKRGSGPFVTSLSALVYPSKCDAKARKSNTEEYFLKKRVAAEKKREKDDQASNSCSVYEYFQTESVLDEVVPNIYKEDSASTVWYKVDKNYLLPKTIIKSRIIVEKLRYPYINNLYFQIYIYYLNQNIIEGTLKEASLSGNSIDFDFTENGVVLTFDCFSDVCQHITNKFYEAYFDDNKLSEKEYADTLELVKIRLEEEKGQKPYQKISMIGKKLLKVKYPLYTNVVAEFPNANYAAFSTFVEDLRSTSFTTALVYGTVDENNLKETINAINYKADKRKINTQNSITNMKLSYLHRTIEGSVVFRMNNDLPTEKNNVIKNYYQIGLRDYQNFAIFEILELCWGRLFFYELRTIKQLGYIVWASSQTVDGVMYFTVLVQGTKEDPSQMNDEIDTVLLKAKDKILKVTDEELDGYKSTLLDQIKRHDETLLKRANRLWTEILLQSSDFSRKSKLVETIKNISINDLYKVFLDVFINNPKKLSVQIYAYGADIGSDAKENYGLNKKITSVVTTNIDYFSNKGFIQPIDDKEQDLLKSLYM